MTVTIKPAKLAASTSDVNLDMYLMDHSKIGDKVRTQPNATTTAYNYAYLTGTDLGARVGLYHNIALSKASVENTIGYGGNFLATDSETGLVSVMGPWSARLVMRHPSQMYVTDVHLAQISQGLFSLLMPSFASGVPSAAIWQRILEGNSAW